MTFFGADLFEMREFTRRFDRHIEHIWVPLASEVEDKVASIFWVGADYDRIRADSLEIVQLPVIRFVQAAREASTLLHYGYAAQQNASEY